MSRGSSEVCSANHSREHSCAWWVATATHSRDDFRHFECTVLRFHALHMLCGTILSMFSISLTALTGLTNQKRKRRGEANLIRVEHRCCIDQSGVRVAAIDTGHNKSAEIADVLCRSRVQTLVLTHDDGDHINGAEYVLRNSPNPIEELWVPAYWMMQDAVLRQLSRSSTSEDNQEEIDSALQFCWAVASEKDGVFKRQTFNDLVEVLEPMDEGPIYDRETDPAREDGNGADAQHSAELGEHFLDEITAALGRIRDADVRLYGQRRRDRRVTPFWGFNNKEMARRTIQSIRVINAILTAAHERGTRIRCFLPATDTPYFNGKVMPQRAWETSGDPGFLTIVNAFEVMVRRPRVNSRVALFMTLAAVTELSQQNRSALVSFVWPVHESANGFLVWSDSSGDWMRNPEFEVPWSQIGGMTAPHHGSANVAHQRIWDELSRHNGKTRIIVSGDLLETRGGNNRAKGIREVLDSSRASEYGVVHCLNPNEGDRFPRTEVEYWSYGETCCCCERIFGIPHRTHTQIRVSQFSRCGTDCLGCHS